MASIETNDISPDFVTCKVNTYNSCDLLADFDPNFDPYNPDYATYEANTSNYGRSNKNQEEWKNKFYIPYIGSEGKMLVDYKGKSYLLNNCTGKVFSMDTSKPIGKMAYCIYKIPNQWKWIVRPID